MLLLVETACRRFFARERKEGHTRVGGAIGMASDMGVVPLSFTQYQRPVDQLNWRSRPGHAGTRIPLGFYVAQHRGLRPRPSRGSF